MKKVVIIIISVLVCLGLVSCKNENSNIYDYILNDEYNEYLVVGTSADYPPYEWPKVVDGKRIIVGLDIEIAKAIAVSMKKNLRVIDKGFDFLLDDLENNKLDLVLSALTPNEKRMKQVSFSKIYYKAEQVILINEKDYNIFNNLDELDKTNHKIGAQLGSIQQDLFLENFNNATNMFLQSVMDLVYNLKEEKIKGIILEKPVAKGFVTNSKNLKISKIVIGNSEDGSAVAVKKGDLVLLEIVNQVIDEMIESKKIDEIVNEMVRLNN